jgi:hypothetical protein
VTVPRAAKRIGNAYLCLCISTPELRYLLVVSQFSPIRELYKASLLARWFEALQAFLVIVLGPGMVALASLKMLMLHADEEQRVLWLYVTGHICSRLRNCISN